MATQFVKSERLRKLPPYLFAEIDKKKKAAIAAGRDIINLGVGDPDRPTPEPIIRSLQHHVENPAFHQYALDQGSTELRRSIAAFCRRRYAVDLDPDTEVLVLIGSKEGLAHLPLAVLNPGEISLVPDPCYPVYRSSSMFAGADVYTMPLEPHLGFRPDLEAIPADVFALARLMFLNYPNNPTGATADLSFFQKVVDLARANQFVIAQDAAYNEMYYEKAPPSILADTRGERRCDRVSQSLQDVQHDGLANRIRHRWRAADRCSWPGEGKHGFRSLHGHPVCRDDGPRRIPQPRSSDSSDCTRNAAMRSSVHCIASAGRSPRPRRLFTSGSPALRATRRPSFARGCSTRRTS